MAGNASCAPGTLAVSSMAGELVEAVVERIEDGIAVVLVGEEEEEWDFPAHLLPPEAEEGMILLLEKGEQHFEVVGIGRSRVDLEARLMRPLSRRRPIILPLPQRSGPKVPPPDVRPTDRPSRMNRDLGH